MLVSYSIYRYQNAYQGFGNDVTLNTFVQFLSSLAILRKWQNESAYVFFGFFLQELSKQVPCIFLSISCSSWPFSYLQQAQIMSK